MEFKLSNHGDMVPPLVHACDFRLMINLHRKEVNLHDFPDKKLGKVSPYGVYDVGRNEGWMSVGLTHDTAEFAVESIRRWWHRIAWGGGPILERRSC